MFTMDMVDRFAESLGPIGKEFKRCAENAPTFENEGRVCVTSAALEKALEGSPAAQYLETFRSDLGWLLRVRPSDFGYVDEAQEPAKVQYKPNCIASSIGH